MRKLIDSGFVTVIRPEAPIEPLKSMKQQSLAETGFLPKVGKPTPKVGFLAEMDTVVPWSRLKVPIEPCYSKKGTRSMHLLKKAHSGFQ